MSWFTKEVKIVLLVLTLAASGLLVAVQYTELCSLQAVTLNGQRVENWENELGLIRSRGILQQPLDSLADALFARQGVRHVKINYFLPNTLHITTTDLTPICYIHDDISGTLFGIDASARVIPLADSTPDWELPILSSVRIRLLFEQPADPRVSLVVPQLKELRAVRPDFFRLINEISFANPDYLTVSVTGLPCAVRVMPVDLMARMDDFITFMEHYKADPFAANAFDLRYDNMIVRVAQPEKKGKDSAAVAAPTRPISKLPATVIKPTVSKPLGPVVTPARKPEAHVVTDAHKVMQVGVKDHPSAKTTSVTKPISPQRPFLPLAPKKADKGTKEIPKPRKAPNGR